MKTPIEIQNTIPMHQTTPDGATDSTEMSMTASAMIRTTVIVVGSIRLLYVDEFDLRARDSGPLRQHRLESMRGVDNAEIAICYIRALEQVLNVRECSTSVSLSST